MKITALYIYPIKGCSGIRTESISFDEVGPINDRRWMLIDDHGKMVSQRNHPKIATLRVEVKADQSLSVTAPDRPPLQIECPSSTTPLSGVEIWGDPASGRKAAEAANAWFSHFLQEPVRLLHQTKGAPRQRRWKTTAYSVSFADGYPLLVCNEASLDDLNRRLSARGLERVEMDRFRPNLVISGKSAWEEDHWKQLSVEGGSIQLTTDCARCTVTTVDQQTGDRLEPREPLATLATFRKKASGIIFGRNALGLPPGTQLKTQTRAEAMA